MKSFFFYRTLRHERLNYNRISGVYAENTRALQLVLHGITPLVIAGTLTRRISI